MLFVLYSSKTHDKSSRPQKIFITANLSEKSGDYAKWFFCPFAIMRQYLEVRGDFASDQDPLFIFKGNLPVKPIHVRQLLKSILVKLGLDSSLYRMHSFRIGRTTDLIKFGYSIDEVKLMGHWKSNVIFKYIR